MHYYYIILKTDLNIVIHFTSIENKMIFWFLTFFNIYVDLSPTEMSHLFGQLSGHEIKNLRSGIFIVKLVTSTL